MNGGKSPALNLHTLITLFVEIFDSQNLCQIAK